VDASRRVLPRRHQLGLPTGAARRAAPTTELIGRPRPANSAGARPAVLGAGLGCRFSSAAPP